MRDLTIALWSTEAEQAVVGGLILDHGLFADVMSTVAIEDFTDSRCREILSAMSALDREGKPFDLVLLVDKLKASGSEGDAIAMVSHLVSHTPSARNAVSYAQVVADRARLRRLVQAWSQSESILSDEALTLRQKAEQVSEAMLKAATTAERNEPQMAKDAARAWLDELERIHAAGGGITGISTGFPDIDKATKGLHGGELIILAARPAMGKTNLALNLAANVAGKGGAVYLSSMEMPSIELMHRLAASVGRCSYEAVQSADFDKAGPNFTVFAVKMKDWKLCIDDAAEQSVASLRSNVKRFKRLHGLDLIVVDYLQLLSSDEKSPYERVSAISTGLKRLAMELNVPVVCLAQLNRGVEQRQDKRPVLSDLRDSGSIEQDANAVMFIYRDVVYNEQCPNPEVAELIIAKLRHGKTGTIPLITKFDQCLFLSADRESMPENWRNVQPKRGPL